MPVAFDVLCNEIGPGPEHHLEKQQLEGGSLLGACSRENRLAGRICGTHAVMNDRNLIHPVRKLKPSPGDNQIRPQ
jgi:hypothetical protein